MSGVNPYLRPAGAITVEEFRASIAATLSGTPLFLDSRTRTVATPLNQPVRLAANASAYQMAVFISADPNTGVIDGVVGKDSNLSVASNHRVLAPSYVALLYAGEEFWFTNLFPAATVTLVSEVVP
jgi:hypothetical protein